MRAAFYPSPTNFPGGDTCGTREAADRMMVKGYDEVESCFNTKSKGQSTGPAFDFSSCHSAFYLLISRYHRPPLSPTRGNSERLKTGPS